jgi:hypothetical protein
MGCARWASCLTAISTFLSMVDGWLAGRSPVDNVSAGSSLALTSGRQHVKGPLSNQDRSGYRSCWPVRPSVLEAG